MVEKRLGVSMQKIATMLGEGGGNQKLKCDLLNTVIGMCQRAPGTKERAPR